MCIRDRRRLESALEFVGQFPINFNPTTVTLKDAICTWTSNLLHQSSFDNLMWICEVACFHGYINVLNALWQFCPQYEQEMQKRLFLCQYSHHSQTLDFAWSHIEMYVRNNAIAWIRRAFNENDTILWQFFFDKGLLSQEIFLSIACCPSMSPSTNMFAFIGCKPVAMLATVWNAYFVNTAPTTSSIASLCTTQDVHLQAQKVGNYAVIAFIDQAMSDHFRLICAHGLAGLVSQIEKPAYWSPQSEYADSKTLTKAREKMWAALQIANPTSFLQTADPCFEMCVFLLDKKVIDAQAMLETLASDRDFQLLDDIRAYTYCAADES